MIETAKLDKRLVGVSCDFKHSSVISVLFVAREYFAIAGDEQRQWHISANVIKRCHRVDESLGSRARFKSRFGSPG